MLERIRPFALMGMAFVVGILISQSYALPTWAVQQQQLSATNQQLKDQLNFVLKTRRPAEKQFVDQVVAGVENGSIPRELVDGVFLWVRKNRADHQYPFFYFERLLRLQAEKKKVVIPAYQYPQ